MSHPKPRCGARQTANRAKQSLGKWLILSSTMAAAAAPSLVAPASADDTDDSFFAALKQHGIVFPDPDAAIAASHGVCAGLDQAQSPPVVVLTVVRNTSLSAHQAGYFVGASVMSYCPKYLGILRHSTS